MGIGSCHQDACAGRQRKDPLFIFQQGDRLIGSSFGCRFILCTPEIGVFRPGPERTFEESQSVLHAQDPPYGIIHTLHRHLSLIHQLHQRGTKSEVVRFHHHIDTGIDGDLHRLLVVSGNLVTREQVLHIRPVGHHHPVKVHLLLEPAIQQATVGMGRYTIDNARVDHDRECTCLNRCTERLKIFLTQVTF